VDTLLQHLATQRQPLGATQHLEVTQHLHLATHQQPHLDITLATLVITEEHTGPLPPLVMINTAEESPPGPERGPDLLPEIILDTKRGVPERGVLAEKVHHVERREVPEERTDPQGEMTAGSPPAAAARITLTTPSILATQDTLVLALPPVATPCTPAIQVTPRLLVKTLAVGLLPLLPLHPPQLQDTQRIRLYITRLDELFQDFLLMTV